MKKLTALLMSLVMVFSLGACSSGTSGSSSEPAESAPSAESENTSSAPESEADSDTASETGKTLVVYYSATGNTEQAANYIAEITGGELFELEPADPYTEEDLNYSNDDSRVVYEHDNPDARDVELVADTVENWEEYDTVFIGYPIWWADLPQALYSFFDEYDFSGKTIIPFNVHNGSRFSRTIQTIQNLEPDATVIEDGFTVSERNVDQADSDVADWLEDLGY